MLVLFVPLLDNVTFPNLIMTPFCEMKNDIFSYKKDVGLACLTLFGFWAKKKKKITIWLYSESSLVSA